MRRKTAIFISLILLLLIGGGGVAFYLHLRKQAPPEFSEVDVFFREIPASTGWRFDARVNDPAWEYFSMHKHGWWDDLGLSREIEVRQDKYRFVHPKTEERVIVTVYREDGRLTVVGGIHNQSLKDAIFRQFPEFVHYYRPDSLDD